MLFLAIFGKNVFESNYTLVHPTDRGGSGVALFAHVGGFIFGWIVAKVLAGPGRITRQEVQWGAT